MLAAGLATFSLLHATQAVLPSIRATFGGGETLASLTVSAATGAVALSVLPISSLAESLGRTRVMAVGVFAACALSALGALAPQYWQLMVLRALVGVALAGIACVATAHITEEAPGHRSGTAVGMYVAGTSIGGLLGRLIPSFVEEFAGWRTGIVILSACSAVAAFLFVRLLPPTRNFTPAPLELRHHLATIRGHLAEPGIRRLCAAGFLLMGGLVAVYNYLGFRLTAAPFGYSQAVVGLVFVAYLAGTVSSSRTGRWANRIGRRRLMVIASLTAAAGLLLTLPDHIGLLIPGLVIFTAGFFAAHAVAVGWVAVQAETGRSQATALYYVAYYAGSSLVGAVMGPAFSAGGWAAVVLGVSLLYVLTTVIAAGVHD